MDENEVIDVDAGAESGAETGNGDSASESQVYVQDVSVTVDSSALAAEVAVLEQKFDILTEQTIVLTDKVTGCYCMLLILAVLGLRNVFRSIIRKVRGGMDDV